MKITLTEISRSKTVLNRNKIDLNLENYIKSSLKLYPIWVLQVWHQLIGRMSKIVISRKTTT